MAPKPYEARTQLGRCRTEVRHGLMWGAASDVIARALVLRVSIFFFLDLQQLGLIRAELSRFDQNRAILAESSRIGQWPKQAEIGLESCRNSRNRLWMMPKHPKSVIPQFYSEYLLLLLCFPFFVLFFVLCFLPSSFIFLWIKA